MSSFFSKKPIILIIIACFVCVLAAVSVYADLNEESNITVCADAVDQPSCYTGSYPVPALSWTIGSDSEGMWDASSQESYEVNIDNNSDFGSQEIDTGEVASTDISYTVDASGLSFNTIYYWRVAIKDDYDSWTDWSNADDSFTTAQQCTLSVVLSVDPSSGYVPLNDVDLTATVGGTMSGTINYTFYCDRSDAGTDITDGWAAKYDGVTDNPKTAADICDYAVIGTYTAKVIVERGALAVEDRQTITVLNNPPTATNFNVIEGDYCTTPVHYFSWTYSDPDGDNESQFQFQVDNDSGFGSQEVNRTITGTWSDGDSNNQTVVVAVSPGADQIGYDTTYYWRVKVWDSQMEVSAWIEGSSFTTEKHRYPLLDFNWSPSSPSQGEDVLFSDQSTVYGGATKSAWSWTFTDGNPVSSSQQNPVIQFTANGSKSVTLQVTDSDNYSCQTSKSVGVQIALPGWQEVLPQ